MGGTGVVDRFLAIFSQYIDSGFGLLVGRRRLPRDHADRDRRDARRAVLEPGAQMTTSSPGSSRRRSSSASSPTSSATGARSPASSSTASPVSASWPAAAAWCRATCFSRAGSPQVGIDAGLADARIHRRSDGLCLLLREFPADHHPALRLGGGHHRLLHPRDPALRHADRVQADDAGGLHPRALRPVRQDRLHGRARARQCRLVGRQGAGARRDRRHRLDALRRVHQRGFRASRPSRMRWPSCLPALSLLALGIFGPGIANGIVAGGPQLGAGAAAGTALLAGGAAVGGVAGAKLAGGAVASAASSVARGTSRAAGGATMAYATGSRGQERRSSCRGRYGRCRARRRRRGDVPAAQSRQTAPEAISGRVRARLSAHGRAYRACPGSPPSGPAAGTTVRPPGPEP